MHVIYSQLKAQHAIPLALLAITAVAVPISIARPQGVARMLQLHRELADVERENSALKHDIAKLRVEIRALRDNPSAVEKIARSQLGFVQPNELVFQFDAPQPQGRSSDKKAAH